MRRKFIAIGFVLVAVSSLHAETANGDAARGKSLSKGEQCQECHGETGLGTAEHYPKLAGQSAAYIRKQLGDFHAGARKSEIMNAMAANLSPQDMADIAAWFSSTPRWSGEQHNFSAAGQTIFLNGDVFRIPTPLRLLPWRKRRRLRRGAESGSGDRRPARILSGQPAPRMEGGRSQKQSWRRDERYRSSAFGSRNRRPGPLSVRAAPDGVSVIAT